MNVYKYILIGCVALACCSASCKKEKVIFNAEDLSNPVSFFPAPPSEWLNTDGTPYFSSGVAGDVMPFYDNGKIHIFYLEADNSGTSGYNPIHSFATTDLTHYKYEGKMISYGADNDPDHGIGAGSLIKVGNIYYLYYCGQRLNNSVQNIVYATSTDLKNWTKKSSFEMHAPSNYESNDFRDPYVFYNSATNEYCMLVSARTGGQPVIALFTTTDLSTDNWTLKSPVYTADNSSFYMMECPQIVQWGSFWYLIFSENNVNKTTHYRISSSPDGPWTTPQQDLLDGEYFYAAKMVSDATNHYLYGWTYTKQGLNDNGAKTWGGNIVSHQLTQNSDGTLSVKIPSNISNIFRQAVTLQHDTIGNATYNNNNYELKNKGEIKFGYLNGKKKITAAISGLKAANEAGFEFGLDRSGSTDHHKIRFKNGMAYVVKVQSDLETIEASVPFSYVEDTTFNVEIVIDGSVAVIDIDHKASLTCRIYWLQNASWGIYSEGGAVNFNQLQLMTY